MRTDGVDESAELVVHYPDLEDSYIDVEKKEVPSFNEVAAEIPSSMSGVAGRASPSETKVGGIPVRTVRSSSTYTSANYFDDQFRPVPVGAAWTTIEDEPDSYCTAGTPVTDDRNGDSALVTAVHCFIIPKSNDFYYFYPSGNADGEFDRAVFDTDPHYDAVVVEPSTFDAVEYDYASNYDYSDYRDIPIWSMHTRDAIKDMRDSGDQLERQGARTGIDSGTIDEVGTYQFTTVIDTADGDSGGPVYRSWHDSSIGRYSYICGIQSRIDKDDSNAV